MLNVKGDKRSSSGSKSLVRAENDTAAKSDTLGKNSAERRLLTKEQHCTTSKCRSAGRWRRGWSKSLKVVVDVLYP